MTPSARPSTGTRLGVSGHRVLPVTALGPVVAGLHQAVAEAGAGVTGVTSLAAGADQLFAREVLAAGGTLHVVLPCSGYEITFEGANRAAYHCLLNRAEVIDTLPFENPSEAAFYAAGRRVVDLCDCLLAVWDGRAARGLGGTADIVAYAHERGRDVRVIWPAGVRR